jgi:di/tricarboxylate transporter
LSLEAWFTLAVIVALVVVLATGRLPASVGMLGATAIMLFAGVITPDQALAGFSNEAPIIIACLLVVARAVELSGIFQPVVTTLLGTSERSSPLLARLLLPVAGLSGFLNNTTLVAMTIPAVLDATMRRPVSASRLLMPVSYAAVLGGVITAIGTSTNLTVSGLLAESGQRPLGLFELTPVGLPIAIAGCLLLVVTAGRLLPERGTMRQAIAAGRDYTVVMRVVRGGPIDGQTVAQAGLRHLQGVFLVQIDRHGQQMAPVAPDDRLLGGDLLTFAGRVDQVVDLHRLGGLESAESRHFDALTGSRHGFFEAVVGEALAAGSPTLAEVGFRGKYGGAVVAIHRSGHRLDAKLGEIRLRMGDTLVVLADLGFRDRWADSRDFLLIAPLRGVPPTQPRNTRRVLAIGLAFLVLTGTGLVPLLQGALAAALLVVLARALTIQQAREAIDLDIVLMVAAAFGMGFAVQASGLGEAIASLLVGALAPLGAIGILAGILLATMALTELVSNNAAAVFLFPIAVAAAVSTGSDPRPFVVAVTLGASLSFLSPIGYQTNLMVYGVGGYRFTDFTRLGLPLTILCFVLTVVLVPLVFPF